MRPRDGIIAFLILIASQGTGCRNDSPRVLSVEFLEDTDEGHDFDFSDPVLAVTLDAPLPDSLRRQTLSLGTSPSINWTTRLIFDKDAPRVFFVRVLSGSEAIEVNGVYSGTPNLGRPGVDGPGEAAMGFGIDLGRGLEWVDIQPRRVHPVLREVVWDDANRNLVVDEGDSLRLGFNRPVLVEPTVESEENLVHVGDDLLLTNPDDRLDDGEIPSTFVALQPGESFVRIRLGSRPRLTPARDFSGALGDPVRGGLPRPSRIALNGTTVQPMAKIVDARTGLGVVSTRAVGIRWPGTHPISRERRERFPEPGGRTYATASVAFGLGVVIVGGQSQAAKSLPEELKQVLLLRPDDSSAEAEPFLEKIGDLKTGRYLHTATTLVGPDGVEGTPDDLGIIVAGGTNGNRLRGVLSRGELEAIRFDVREQEFRIEPVLMKETGKPASLLIPRFHHTATRIAENRVVFIGGFHRDPRPGHANGVVSVAETFSFDEDDQGRIVVTSRVKIPLELARMRHSATSLGPLDANRKKWSILIYGGFGKSPGYHDLTEGELFSYEKSVILASPEVLNIDLEAEERSGSKLLRLPYRLAHLRYDHQATRVSDTRRRDDSADESPEPAGPATREVLVTGGTLGRLLDPATIQWQWEFPPREDLRSIGIPDASETANSLLITLDVFTTGEREEQLGIYLADMSVLDSPYGESRVHHGTVLLPELGVLTLGGSHPSQGGEAFRTGELYVTASRRLAPLSLSLNDGRRLFATAVLRREDEGLSVFVIGGEVSDSSDEAPVAVEEIRLPPVD